MIRNYFAAILVLVALAACTQAPAPEAVAPDETPQEAEDAVPPAEEQAVPQGRQVTLDACTADPENADAWASTPVNVWDSPGGSIVDSLPACDAVALTVLEETEDYYRVSYGGAEGWISASLFGG